MAFYNLKKKPALTTKEGETETMYADIVYSGTIPAERLIRGVAKRTGFKEGVIEGILMELKDDVLQYLGEGYRVELGEFGFFSAKVKASRLVANKNDIRSESVAFNGVNFRASRVCVWVFAEIWSVESVSISTLRVSGTETIWRNSSCNISESMASSQEPLIRNLQDA